ncbi:ABC transporter ATP-binding protein [Paraburkholderia sp. ZP32-5]|uniref:ABC transporter ATP-binding protein n=1 Tax=Paraburkholderia sp. ZP32-5 TaxID=2883245 RepID=UPI001F1DB1EE|nr:ABC transporter ATP-binding protein [Paraburkholderia sp. ZP32-5]
MLQINGIHSYYGDSHVLHGVSLDVKPGTVTSVLGRNGAGKTTTVLSIMGHLKPRSGEVIYEGRRITGLPPHRISRLGLGFVPQERGVFPSLSVEENLTVAARPGRTGDWTLSRIYELFPRLGERRKNRGFQLSGGEQQMVSIARALMLNPSTIILDEPSEGLALMIVNEIVEIMRQMKRAGMALLLIEQNLNAALELADIHYVLSKGQVCFVGTSETLRGNENVLSEHLSV